MTKDNTVNILIGLGCGVGAALLLTPRSGGQTRALITNKTLGGADSVKQQVNRLVRTATDLFEKGNQEVKRVERAIEVGRRAYTMSVVKARAAA